MSKLKNNESGFSAVEGLLILVVVAIVGFTGWYVYHAQKNANKNLATTSSTTPKFKNNSKTKTSKTQTTTTATSLASYTDDAKTYSLSYPKTWTVSQKKVPGGSGSFLSTLESIGVLLEPANAPATGNGEDKAAAFIEVWDTGDLSGLAKDQLGAGVATDQLTINGYKALHGTVTRSEYTDENYFVTSGSKTLSLSFRIKQSANSTGLVTYDASSFDAEFSAIAKSVKFVTQ